MEDDDWEAPETIELFLGDETCDTELTDFRSPNMFDPGPPEPGGLPLPLIHSGSRPEDPRPIPDVERRRICASLPRRSRVERGSVMGAFERISGVIPTQTALKSLRMGLFLHVLGDMTRDEKRSRQRNIAVFESRRAEILTMLENSQNCSIVRDVCWRGTRKPSDITELLMRAHGI
jgi:hypothetical protein